MLKIEVYSVNFKYDGEGNIEKIEVSFNSDDNQAQTYLNGYVTLTEDEFNVEGGINEKVITKLSKVLAEKVTLPSIEEEEEEEEEEEVTA